MKRLIYVLVYVLLAVPVSAQSIDLGSVIVEGSSPAVLQFPRTAVLTHFGITPNDMQIRTSGTDGWPEVGEPKNGRDGQAATLWVFRRLNGQWIASGAERLRKYQLNGSKQVADPTQGGLSTLIGNGWLYDPARWPTLAGRNPSPGEPVGFMVAAGSTRSDNTVQLAARTQVIVVEWPGAAGAQPLRVLWQEGQDAIYMPTGTPPVGQPALPVAVAPDAFRVWAADFERWARDFADWSRRQTEYQNDQLKAIQDQNERIYRDLAARVDASSQRAPVEPVKVDQGNVRGIVNLILGIAGAVGGGIAAVR